MDRNFFVYPAQSVWNLLAKLSDSEHRVRLPDSVSVALPEPFRLIVDHPDFQRLRRVRQLGPIHLVYPGAVHTRFEHSLGVFQAAADYARGLSAVEAFADRVNEDDIVVLMLAALLHDVGHYPFAHSLEALHSGAFSAPRHEDLASAILKGEVTTGVGPSIGEIIAAELGADPERVAALVRLGPHESLSPVDRLLASIINSAIDCDKLDYLARDSVHMGVPYGRMPDRARLTANLTGTATGDRIALNEKGRVSGEIFLFSRYLMFSEAYWHHAVRSASAMIEGALADHVARTAPTAAGLTELLLRASDDDLLSLLVGSGDTDSARLTHGLVGARGLYKRVLTLSRQHPDSRDAAAYDAVYGLRGDELRQLATAMRETIGMMARRTVGAHELLIDTPPRDKDSLDPVDVVFDSGRQETLASVSRVVRGIAGDFIKVVKRIRVFVAPDVRAALSEAGADETHVREQLIACIMEAT